MTSLFSPKIPEPQVVSQPATPTSDEAMERQRDTERVKFRTGRASTRLAGGALTGRAQGYKLLSGAS